MALYTVHFSTIVKRSIFDAQGNKVSDTTEFKKQTMTGLPLRVAMQYDTQPDFRLVAEVPSNERRGKPPRTPSQVNWDGGSPGTRTLKGERGAAVPKSKSVDRKDEAAATGDLGAAISQAA